LLLAVGVDELQEADLVRDVGDVLDEQGARVGLLRCRGVLVVVDEPKDEEVVVERRVHLDGAAVRESLCDCGFVKTLQRGQTFEGHCLHLVDLSRQFDELQKLLGEISRVADAIEEDDHLNIELAPFLAEVLREFCV